MEQFPAEVLQRIFEIGHYDFDNGLIVLFQPTSFIQKITRISGYWRALAFSMPTLWTNISFNQPLLHPSSDKWSTIDTALRQYLSLSGERPLRMEFGDIRYNFSNETVKAITATTSRWESLAFNHHLHGYFITGHMLRGMNFTCLTSLVIEFANSIHLSFKSTPALTNLTVRLLERSPDLCYTCDMPDITFSSTPSLTHFSASHHITVEDTYRKFPWGQITHFESIENLYAPAWMRNDEFSKLINRMSRLESLSISGDTKSNTVVKIPYLRTLNLLGGRKHRRKDITDTDALTYITALRLQTLLIDIEVSPSDIVEFLERSDCWLEEFAIHRTSLREVWKTPQLQTVKKLRISSPNYIIEDLKQLTKRHDDPLSVLPELESMEIRDVPISDKCVLLMLIDMLKSRLPSVEKSALDNGTCLKSFTINFNRELDDDERGIWNEFISSDTVRLSGPGTSIVEGHGRS